MVQPRDHRILSKSQKNRLKKKANRPFKKTPHTSDWSTKLGKALNYAKYGILHDPNIKPKEKEKLLKAVPEEEKKQLPEPFPERGTKSKGHVPFVEQQILSKLIEKYGDDYQKMAMDVKVNKYQHTPTQLKKKIEHYKKYLQNKEEKKKEREEKEKKLEEAGIRKKRKKKKKKINVPHGGLM